MHIFEFSLFGTQIGPTWYGLMYVLGFIICYSFIKRFFTFRGKEDLDILLQYVFFGIILGGRIGYIMLYNWNYFIDNPISILKVWEGGMSFHGGCVGAILAVLIFAKKYSYEFWKLIDTLAVIVPVAIGLGRIGNWINNELPGYAPYHGVFPMILGGTPHFPSPLFEMFLEGICLFFIMVFFYFYKKKRNPGFLSAIFLIGYSMSRIVAEQYRLPDAHIGYLFDTNWITLGILYTFPMFIYGIYLLKKNI